MSKTLKILIFGLLIGGVAYFGLFTRRSFSEGGPFQIFQISAQEELPIFVKPLEKIEKPLYVPDEIIVKFKTGVKKEDIDNFNGQKGTEEKYESPYARFKILKIPATKTVEETIEIYKKNPNVEYAEPNYYAYALMIPNDPHYPKQWHLDNPVYGGIQMEQAWDISTGTQSVVVAVADTGVAYENYRGFERAPDLANTTFVAGYDFVNNDTHPNDDEGHGTHVTGTIAQSTNNNLGVAGIAFNTAIMPVKVLNAAGSGTYQQVADGIMHAANNGAKVINLSLGGSATSTVLENAVAYAYNNGVTVLAAAGNDNSSTLIYPAGYNAYVIAVGATQYDETRSYYSSYGSSLDLVAPGGDVTVDQNSDGYGDGVLQQTFGTNPKDWGYWFYQGTSMATPHVSGVAALILAQNPTFTSDQVRERLQSTADDLGTAGRDNTFGWGLVNAYRAVAPIAISITTDGIVNFGIVALGATVDSSGDVQIVRVDAGPANLNIKTTLYSDGTNNWALGTTNNDNQVIWEYSKEGTGWNKFLAANTLYSFDSNVPQLGIRNLYLKLTMPTATISTAQYSSIVTIVATAP